MYRFSPDLWRICLVRCAWLAAMASTWAAAAEPVDFNRQVAPILVKRCLECHSESVASGDLVLTSHERLLAGGASGVVVVPGDPDSSLLLERVTLGEMPPEKKGKSQQLPDEEIETLRAWIAGGAPWPAGRTLDPYESTTDSRAGRDWWSWQPIQRATPPTPPNPGDAANPIDAFILARLADEGLRPAPLADRRTLLRRVYYDVTGLPPPLAEIESFETDRSPDAYERVVDRLLSSPQFGERWARHWLDVVRFAETSGYERDQEKPGAWRYRDWVVDAFNNDKPYDRFVLEQLAGDELPDRNEQSVIATGFLRLGTWNDEPNDPEEYKYERLEDLVHATSSAFLASTVKCARCHDHKFDPIPQSDYYRLAAAFWPGPIEPRDRKWLGGPTPEELGYDVLGWTDITNHLPPLPLLKNGDPHHPLEPVDPGVLSAIPALDRPFAAPPADAATTLRRTQLAQWIIDPRHPLTARVIVNRLWLYHFGEGLVRTPNDFGFQGDTPSHPELLDWLAAELIDNGWSLKHIHRLILTSRTYRQASVHPEELAYRKRDAANRLWWRAQRRRLDAEQIRDSLLSAAGQLDLRMGGPSFKPSISPEALEGLSRKGNAWNASPEPEQRRRSLYIYSQRSLLTPLLTTFDFADTTLPCGQRDVTTVAPQALALLNNALVHQQSEQLARHILDIADDEPDRVRLAWQVTLGREPTTDELESALRHIRVQLRNFQSRPEPTVPPATPGIPARDRLSLHLRSDLGLELDAEGNVLRWQDQSGRQHHAVQEVAEHRPQWLADRIHGLPALHFNGDAKYLQIAEQILSSQNFTIVAVVVDQGPAGHREILSNWNGGAGNSITSVFLGLTGERAVRLSDHLVGGALQNSNEPFVLAGIAGAQDASVLQNNVQVLSKGASLPERNLSPPYVIGRQGSLEGEYWRGDIAELLVFDRELDRSELEQLWRALADRYRLVKPEPPRTADLLALASLCHVLMNTNEFIYVD